MVLWFENEHWYGFFRECIMTCSLASGSPPETQVVDRIDSQAQNLWCVSELLFWGFFSLFNVSGMVSDVALVSEDREARRRGKNFMKETSSETSCITYSCRKTWLDIQNFLRWQFLIYQKQCTSHHTQSFPRILVLHHLLLLFLLVQRKSSLVTNKTMGSSFVIGCDCQTFLSCWTCTTNTSGTHFTCVTSVGCCCVGLSKWPWLLPSTTFLSSFSPSKRLSSHSLVLHLLFLQEGWKRIHSFVTGSGPLLLFLFPSSSLILFLLFLLFILSFPKTFFFPQFDVGWCLM